MTTAVERQAAQTGAAARQRRLARFVALVRKESYQIVRDPSSILIALVLPLILIFLFGYAVSLDATRTRIGLVIEAPTPAARSLAASFQASRYFDVTLGSDRRQFTDDLVRGRIKGIVVIPATFAGDQLRPGGSSSIQVIVDGTNPNTASFVQNDAQGVLASWAAGQQAETGAKAAAINVQQRFWFNPQLSSRFFLVPGAIAIVMTLVGTLLTALVIAREWERGTMEAIMATPVTAAELLAGKVIPYFILALMSTTLCVVIAVFVFGVPFRGSIGALYALSAAFLVPSLGQGMLISAATKNQFLAAQIALISAFMPAFLLSGFLFEIGSMPQIIQWITVIVPARYLIPGLQTVFLAGDIWPLFLRDIGVMLLEGGILFALAIRNTKKRLA